jgi:hypothetical protein
MKTVFRFVSRFNFVTASMFCLADKDLPAIYFIIAAIYFQREAERA